MAGDPTSLPNRSQPPRVRLVLADACLQANQFGGARFSIGAVRKHRLTLLKMELDTIEVYRDDVGLE